MLSPPVMSLVAFAPRSVGVASAADWRAFTFLAMGSTPSLDDQRTLDRLQTGCYPWPSTRGDPVTVRLIVILVRSVVALLLLSLGATSSPAQSTCSITLKAGEEGNVTSKRGETVTICLPLNSGTGYSWQVQVGGDAMTLPSSPA